MEEVMNDLTNRSKHFMMVEVMLLGGRHSGRGLWFSWELQTGAVRGVCDFSSIMQSSNWLPREMLTWLPSDCRSQRAELAVKQPISCQDKMISYVECLGGEGAGPGVASRCWNGGPDEERDELLPRKIAALQPKMEGSLRRRLLSAKIHQHHDAILGLNSGGVGRPVTPSGDKKPLPPHFQYPGNSPWYHQQPHPPRPHVHPSLTPEAHGKLSLAPEAHGKLSLAPEAHGKLSVAPEAHGKPNPPSLQLPRPACPILTRSVAERKFRPPHAGAPPRIHPAWPLSAQCPAPLQGAGGAAAVLLPTQQEAQDQLILLWISPRGTLQAGRHANHAPPTQSREVTTDGRTDGRAVRLKDRSNELLHWPT
ncbi:hypothetical protein L3Q82_010014 [Scortum barcoo]|uniref:Uncharacterized protein n=1 Tax=Scortum barcoo TaxID=214431 RepID=A0ACB8WEC3_9TELE|nr:hypothetical protein L3Q82_010014 [Scortum barcoo]